MDRKHPLAGDNGITVPPNQQRWKATEVGNTSADSKVVNPCQDSLRLCRFLVRTFSKPGDFVVDMCSGSGTYSVAALLERRHALAFDTDPRQKHGFMTRLLNIQKLVDKEQEKCAAAKAPHDDPEYVWDPEFHVCLENLN